MQYEAILEERITGYVTVLQKFLHRRHRVLILFPEQKAGSFGWLLARAVERCGCVSVSAEGDFRWKNILYLAFSDRTETVIGTAHMILGLHKASKATSTPLFVHDALVCGGCKSWQQEGIRQGLDCRVWEMPEEQDPALDAERQVDPMRDALEDQLLFWSSILDFQVNSTESGTSLEVIVFPGEKIPELPSCARLTLRQWKPDFDVPFSLKISENS